MSFIQPPHGHVLKLINFHSTRNPGGLAPPLFLHSSVQGSIQGRLREGSIESEWEQRIVSIFRSQARGAAPCMR